jgi:hypothetical protein
MADFNPKPEIPGDGNEMLTYVSPGDRFGRRILIRLVENMAGRKRIKPLYQNIRNREISGREVWSTAVEILGVQPVFDQAKLDAIPKDGPLVFIANHPFGEILLRSCVRSSG